MHDCEIFKVTFLMPPSHPITPLPPSPLSFDTDSLIILFFLTELAETLSISIESQVNIQNLYGLRFVARLKEEICQ